jgi:hypothetical protein
MQATTTLWSHIQSLAPRPKVGHDGRLEIFFSMSKGEIGALSRRLKDELGLDLHVSRNYSLALECVVYNLLLAALIEVKHEGDCVVVVSRDRNSYRKAPKVYGYQHIAYENLTTVLDLLHLQGFMGQQRGIKSEGYKKGLRTKIWPTERFTALMNDAIEDIAVSTINGRGRLVLRDGDGHPQRYIMMGERRMMYKSLQAINSFNEQFAFSYQPRAIFKSFGNLAIAQETAPWIRLEAHHLCYDRIFNHNWDNGGRFYADFQNLERAERGSIWIDGQPTVELDFSSLHPTMLYHMSGHALPGKPYQVEGVSLGNRDAAKVALLCVFNAADRRSATSAIIKELRERSIVLKDRLRVRDLIDRLLTAHEPIAKHFFSGVGTRLQFLDSEIAVRILTAFAARSKPCLGIHDSFLVRAEDEDLLRATMEAAYQEVLRGETYKFYGDWVPGITRKQFYEDNHQGVGTVSRIVPDLTPNSTSSFAT